MKAHEFHGMAGTLIYAAWQAMIQRCTNPRNADWKHYGGRGVTVCDRWRNSFVAFHADMGPRPKGMWIDRADNDKGYEPGNCKWATPTEQANNRRARSRSRNNVTGVTGVSWHSSCRTFRVVFNRRPLGSRRDFFEACCLRKSAEAHLGSM